MFSLSRFVVFIARLLSSDERDRRRHRRGGRWIEDNRVGAGGRERRDVEASRRTVHERTGAERRAVGLEDAHRDRGAAAHRRAAPIEPQQLAARAAEGVAQRLAWPRDRKVLRWI